MTGLRGLAEPAGARHGERLYAWDSTFAIVYEVDLEGVVHRRDVYPPRGHENWSLPKP